MKIYEIAKNTTVNVIMPSGKVIPDYATTKRNIFSNEEVVMDFVTKHNLTIKNGNNGSIREYIEKCFPKLTPVVIDRVLISAVMCDMNVYIDTDSGCLLCVESSKVKVF